MIILIFDFFLDSKFLNAGSQTSTNLAWAGPDLDLGHGGPSDGLGGPGGTSGELRSVKRNDLGA